MNNFYVENQKAEYKKDIENLFSAFNNLTQYVQQLEEENKELKNEHYKDKELNELREQLARAEREILLGFSISEEEYEQIRLWKKEHDNNKHPDSQNSYEYIFYPTSIGTIGECHCVSCKQRAIDDSGSTWRSRLEAKNGLLVFHNI